MASSDTIRPARAKSTAPLTRRPAPMILPGTKLDTNFNALPTQDPAVHKVAPAWLRAKAIGKPMYVVDGKVATPAQLRQLQQKQVASVNVLEGRKAAKLYGRNARQGMVVITTNAGLQPKP